MFLRLNKKSGPITGYEIIVLGDPLLMSTMESQRCVVNVEELVELTIIQHVPLFQSSSSIPSGGRQEQNALS